jgi:hypothetical protein
MGSRSSEIQFIARDIFSRSVVATTKTWGGHVIKRHPEMAGEEHRTKDAIENPETVIEGHTPSHEVFVGRKIQGSGFVFGGKRVVGVVWYDAEGRGSVITTFPTALDPPGKVLWTRQQRE